MNHLATCKYVNMLDPVSIGAAAYTPDNVVDTNGFNYLTVVISVGQSTAMTALKIIESANSNMSSSSDVAVFGTTLDIDGGTSTLPSGDNDEIHVVNVDLRGRKRYLSFAGTSGGTTVTSVLGILSKGSETTNVLADRGVVTMIEL